MKQRSEIRRKQNQSRETDIKFFAFIFSKIQDTSYIPEKFGFLTTRMRQMYFQATMVRVNGGEGENAPFIFIYREKYRGKVLYENMYA